MNVTDIVTLAKQGYKPGDIKELIELAKTVQDEPEKEEPEKEVPEKDEPEKEVPEEKEDSEELISIKKELEETKKQLAELQKDNTKHDMSDKQDDDQVIADLVKSFM